MKKKITVVILSFLLIFLYSAKSVQYIAYAEKIEEYDIVEELYPANEITSYNVAIAPAIAPLIAEYGVPFLLSILTVYVIGMNNANNVKMPNVVSQRLINGIDTNFKSNITQLNTYVSQVIQNAHPATIAFLVMGGAYGTDAEADVEQEMEDIGWEPQFIQSVKEEISGGGDSGSSGDKDPKGKVDFAKLIKYGVISLFSASFVKAVYDIINKFVLSGTESNDIEGVFGRVYKSGITTYRWCDLLLTSEAKYSPSNSFRMRQATDLNMDLVQQVKITMNDVQKYNYGWDGVVYTQQYILKSISGGGLYMFQVAIGKALSPNQYIDVEWDGIGFGFYKLNPDTLEIEKGATENCFNTSLDTSRLEMTKSVPNVGINLYTGGSTSRIDFDYVREIARTALGADLFPQLASDYTFSLGNGNYSANVLPFCDFSKAVPGVYTNQWKVTDLVYDVPEFDKEGNYEVTFPDSIPAGNSNILEDSDVFQPRIVSSENPGTAVASPGLDTSLPIGKIYNPAKEITTVDVDTKTDLPTSTDLTLEFPTEKIGNPTIPDVKIENPADTDSPSKPGEDTDSPSKPGEDTDSPSIPDFGPIPNVEIDFTPLTTCFTEFTERFPFSLPWDLGRIVNSFEVGSGSINAPVWKFSILNTEVTLDFNFVNSWSGIIRGFTFVEYVIGLFFIVRKFTP